MRDFLCAIKSKGFQQIKSFCSCNWKRRLANIMKFLFLIASIAVVVLAASTVAYTPSRNYPEQRRQHPTPAAYRAPPQPSYRSVEQAPASAPATLVINVIQIPSFFFIFFNTWSNYILQINYIFDIRLKSSGRYFGSFKRKWLDNRARLDGQSWFIWNSFGPR